MKSLLTKSVLVVLLGVASLANGHNLDCGFDKTLCNWSVLPNSDSEWEPAVFTSEHDSYVLFKPQFGSAGTERTLESPLVTNTRMGVFNFTYLTVIGGNGALSVSIQSYFENSTRFGKELVLFKNTKTSQGKHEVSINLFSETGRFRLYVEAYAGDKFYGVMQVDEFRFTASCYDSRCLNGGTCSVTDEGAARCDCAHGYTGNACETLEFNENICENVKEEFSPSLQEVTPLLSENFKLRCSVMNYSQSDDELTCDADKKSSFVAVMSVVISKEDPTSGVETTIAMISTFDPVTSFLDSNTTTSEVEGYINPPRTSATSEFAYVSITWPEPDQSVAGVYHCHVSALDSLGYSRVGSSKVKVDLVPATNEALLVRVAQLLTQVKELQKENEACNSKPKP